MIYKQKLHFFGEKVFSNLKILWNCLDFLREMMILEGYNHQCMGVITSNTSLSIQMSLVQVHFGVKTHIFENCLIKNQQPQVTLFYCTFFDNTKCNRLPWLHARRFVTWPWYRCSVRCFVRKGVRTSLSMMIIIKM